MSDSPAAVLATVARLVGDVRSNELHPSAVRLEIETSEDPVGLAVGAIALAVTVLDAVDTLGEGVSGTDVLHWISGGWEEPCPN